MQLATFKNLAPRGWRHQDKCDAILFDALRHVALNEPFNIERANQKGKWLRRPLEYGNCGATTSRDMLIGIMVYLFHFKRDDLVNELFDYGVKHLWKMGDEFEPPNTRVWATPNIAFTLCKLKNKLTGSRNVFGYLPIGPYSTSPGYPSHLTALLINLRGDLDGRINWYEKSVIKKMVKLNPRNPLFLAMSFKWLGIKENRDKCLSILNNTWPQDRLANTRDWSEEWRTQRRDSDRGLEPDINSEFKEHCGGDLLYCYHILGMT